MSAIKMYLKGYEAYEKGVNRDRNPYFFEVDAEAWTEWDNGWEDAKLDEQDYLAQL